MVKVEVFSSPGCGKCGHAKEVLRRLATEMDGIKWREVNVLGLLWPGWLKLRLPWISMRGRRVAGVWGAFLLGIPFSVAVCPFCTPALMVTLTAAAAIGSVPFGLALLLAFALGRSIPIALGTWSMGWLESLKMLSRYQKGLEIVAGITLILAGLYLLNEYFFIVQY